MTRTPMFDYSKLRVIMGSPEMEPGGPAPTGETERRGAWPVPRHLDVRVLLGSVELDLRDATLATGITTIDIDVTLGSVEIIIPPDLAVEVGMVAMAASVDETTGFQPSERLRPILRIIGDARLASCEIVRRAA